MIYENDKKDALGVLANFHDLIFLEKEKNIYDFRPINKETTLCPNFGAETVLSVVNVTAKKIVNIFINIFVFL